MGGSTYTYTTMKDFRGGINMEPENAAPNQLLDARNVWAPNGTIVQRPGLLPIASGNATISGEALEDGDYAWAHVASAGTLVASNINAGGTFTLSSMAVGDYLYVGFTLVSTPNAGIRAVHGIHNDGNANHRVNPRNAELTKFSAEYYTGSAWKRMPLRQGTITVASSGAAYYAQYGHFLAHQTTDGLGFFFVPGNDWALAAISIIDSTARYYLRMRVLSAAPTSTINIRVVEGAGSYGPFLTDGITSELINPIGLGQARFDGGVSLFWKFFTNEVVVANAWPAGKEQTTVYTGTGITEKTGRPAVATLPQFSTMFISWYGDVFEISKSLAFSATNSTTFTTTTSPPSIARVETDPSLVGTNAPYDPALVAQLVSVPRAHYITSFNGVLFGARIIDIQGGDSLIRWTAAGQGFRVWPEESFADLAEDDNSPITGLTSLNEFPVVFKQDSIWNMVYVGTSELDEGNSGGLPLFNAVQVTNTVGCVANSSIAKTPLGLIFLYEDGFYVYNGREAQKISQAIDPIIKRISAAAPNLISAVYWASRNCYVCALPIDGAGENNIILVYDLKHNAWWVWDSTDAQCLAIIEDSADKEQLQFVDKYGRIMQFQEGKDDYGYTPTAYIETHRLVGDGIDTITCREVIVNSEDSAPTISVQVIPDDDVNSATTATLDYTDLTNEEAVYGSAIYGTDVYTPVKRKDRFARFRKKGTWFRLKIFLATAFVKLVVHKIVVGVVGAEKPRRRRR